MSSRHFGARRALHLLRRLNISTPALRDSISRAHAWRRAWGNRAFATPLADFVVNEAHPDVWDANHVDRIRAETPADIDALLREMDVAFAHTRDRVVITDDFTPPSFLARIAFEDFREQFTVLQMALVGEPTPVAPCEARLREVRDDADWDQLWLLVQRDFAEGGRSGGVSFGDGVARGLFEGYRAKRDIAPFFIAELEGVPAAYGSAVACPDEVGLIDDIFTLPEYRGRGLACAIIHHGVARLRQAGRRVVSIGALTTDRPKRLYAKLGFAPLMLARTWVKDVTLSSAAAS